MRILLLLASAFWFYRALTQPKREKEAKRRKEHRLALAQNNKIRAMTGRWLPKVEPWRPA